VRSMFTCLTLLATVMHFTFGCCLHASHFGGSDTCCTSALVSDHGGDCGESHDHDHDLTATTVPGHDAGATDGSCHAAAAASSCDCEGCTCVAIVPTHDVRLDGPSPGAWIGDGLLAPPVNLTSPGLVGRGHESPPLSALRPPLFERLLV
jgi:hypothetical protein